MLLAVLLAVRYLSAAPHLSLRASFIHLQFWSRYLYRDRGDSSAFLTGARWDVDRFIGLLMLVGIVVKNGIPARGLHERLAGQG